MKPRLLEGGVGNALLSATLFGVSTPIAKLLVGKMPPLLLAGLLYAGSGLGLTILRMARRQRSNESRLTRADVPWLAGAVFFGGVLAPALLMIGLASTPASTASLLLNLEGVLTALFAWFIFRENFDTRIAVGMLVIVAGGVLLSWTGDGRFSLPWGAAAIVAACACWGMDNNLTQKVSASDPTQIAAIKGAVAGAVNLSAAIAFGSKLPALPTALTAMLLGFLAYGLSLVLFVYALRSIGTARTGAYYSTAPFVGALLALAIFHESVTWQFIAAALLMGVGIWLHVTEKHGHEHTHTQMEHCHKHVHDDHHQHDHGPNDPPGEPHEHVHVHVPLKHTHAHFPDIHHRHEHSAQ